MKHRIIVWALALMALTLAGCATPTRMAFEDDAQKVTETSKPIYLMTATIKNSYKPSYQPKLIVVNVEKAGAKETADRLNFTMDDKAVNNAVAADAGNSYLLRLELEAGRYEIRGLTSQSFSFPFVAMFFTPLHATLDVSKPGVYYLGHVSATVRERQGEEFKAGPSVPLIDQAVAGASSGTFDVEISDRFATDEAVFRAKFPALNGVAIQKAVLPAFDRVKAQQWWAAN